jgi:branched-chain amino acid transport system permease protein
LLYALTLTPLGRLLNAVRDNPERVAFVGYNPQRVRYLAFAIAAFFAGIGGGLSALHFESVSAGVFSAQRSGLYLLFTFLGGAGFFFGPIIGAVLMVLIQVLLPALTPAWLLYLGLIFVAMVMYAPGGLAAWLVQLRPVRSGWWWRGWAPALGLAFSGLLALGGLVLLVEMTYHLQQSAALGSNLRFAGLLLDTQSPACWFGASAALLLGGGLMAWQRRRLLERGQQMPGRSP